MRICIDIQSAITQRAGIGRYTRELAKHLCPQFQEDQFVLTYFDFKARGERLNIPGAEERRIGWCPGRIVQRAWKTLHWPPYDLFAGPADVYHFPNFVAPPLRRGRSVVSIHDLSFIRYPEFTEDRNARHLKTCLRDTISRADAIITISDFSAREIHEILDVPTERIFRVYCGIAEGFQAPPPETTAALLTEAGLEKPYILTVGTLEPRKNIPFLIDMFEALDDFDGDLVIAGGLGWKYAPILARIQESPKADRIRYLQRVGDEFLPALYAGAELFMMPSFYEGFGFPPIEAMACGTPVVSSAGGSLPEVVGDAAIVIEDYDVDVWKEHTMRALTDSELRADLCRRGESQARTYTWKAAAEATHAVYRKVAG